MASSTSILHGIRIPAGLWSSTMLPEGILERWIANDGAEVRAGAPVAVVRIEDALHTLTAPAQGRLNIARPVNSAVEPGAVIGYVAASA